MSRVEFNEERSTPYRQVQQHSTMITWVASAMGMSQQVVSLLLIIISVFVIVVAVMLPSIVLTNNQLVDPNAQEIH